MVNTTTTTTTTTITIMIKLIRLQIALEEKINKIKTSR